MNQKSLPALGLNLSFRLKQKKTSQWFACGEGGGGGGGGGTSLTIVSAAWHHKHSYQLSSGIEGQDGNKCRNLKKDEKITEQL